METWYKWDEKFPEWRGNALTISIIRGNWGVLKINKKASTRNSGQRWTSKLRNQWW